MLHTLFPLSMNIISKQESLLVFLNIKMFVKVKGITSIIHKIINTRLDQNHKKINKALIVQEEK